MKLLIHDLNEEQLSKLIPVKPDDTTVISDDGSIRHCLGCFGCWVKTPGTCVIHDNYADTGEKISKCEEVVIISKCFYGGFSPFVKNVLDRGISYMHPYFTIRNGELHHRRRYGNHIDLSVWFYGDNITEVEKETAERLIHANAINLDCSVKSVGFVREIEQVTV
ncbi:MAG: hypothetical protein BWY11_00368 [Firmicutes bacterium ADurb.Bin182]|nr:MAG: hypothetical protein BWY11_00368 [Firmicutes bacterium ADurb.Bin182]